MGARAARISELVAPRSFETSVRSHISLGKEQKRNEKTAQFSETSATYLFAHSKTKKGIEKELASSTAAFRKRSSIKTGAEDNEDRGRRSAAIEHEIVVDAAREGPLLNPGILVETVANVSSMNLAASSAWACVIARARVTAYNNPGAGVILVFLSLSACCGVMGFRTGWSVGVSLSDEKKGNAVTRGEELANRSSGKNNRSTVLTASTILSAPREFMERVASRARASSQASFTFFHADTDGEEEGSQAGSVVGRTPGLTDCGSHAERIERVMALVELLKGSYKKFPKDRGRNTIFAPKDRFFAAVPAAEDDSDDFDDGPHRSRKDLQRWKLGRLSYWKDQGAFEQGYRHQGFVDLNSVQELSSSGADVVVDCGERDGMKVELVILFPSEAAAQTWRLNFSALLTSLGISLFGHELST